MSEYFKNLKYDLPAAIIVFLVAVPLCLGIALASLPPEMAGTYLFSGIIAGIVGGIIVGLLSGSQLGVSGPAAGLAVIVLNAITKLEEIHHVPGTAAGIGFKYFMVAVVIGGAFQLILGLARAGVIGYFFPSSVIKGMLAGIGIVIFYKQVPIAFGAKGGTALLESVSNASTSTVIITAVSLGILILWEQQFMKKIKVFQLLQGPLVVVGLGIVLGSLLTLTNGATVNGVETVQQFVSIPTPANFSDFMGQFTIPKFGSDSVVEGWKTDSEIWSIGLMDKYVWQTGLTIAIVASLETLLCLDATDKLDPYKRVAPPNKELIAQGVGNMFAGFLGGLPVTQVIVRSSTNIQSGGRTKVAAIVHGIIMLVCAFAIPGVLNKIPLASLAAILFMVGYKLAKPVLFKTMYSQGRTSFVPFVTTIAGIVFVDLLVGIGLGLAVAILFILYNNYKKPFLFDKSKHMGDGRIHLELAEDVTFINKASIQRTLTELPDGSSVVIDASKTVNMDHDVYEIIQEFQDGAEHRNITVEILELSSPGVKNQASLLQEAMGSGTKAG